MTDLQLREKLKKVFYAAKFGEQIKKPAKQAGLIVCLLFFGIGVIFLLALAVSLWMNDRMIAALITGLLGILLSYITVKLITADTVQSL